MKILVLISMVPLILVEGLVRLVDEMVVSLVDLIVRQLRFQFVVEISVFPYADTMMWTWHHIFMWKNSHRGCNGIVVIRFLFECLAQTVNWKHGMVRDIWVLQLAIGRANCCVTSVVVVFTLTCILVTQMGGSDWGCLQLRLLRTWTLDNCYRY